MQSRFVAGAFVVQTRVWPFLYIRDIYRFVQGYRDEHTSIFQKLMSDTGVRPDRFLHRYTPDSSENFHPVDGLPPHEGAFLPCTLWLADVYVQMGRRDQARAVVDRVTGVANDLGLLSEEYDPAGRRLLGNFPQALTHLALVNSAFNLSGDPASTAAHRRSKER